MSTRFDEALPRLAAAYNQGVLVPFLGAGMSVPACPGWEGLITGLEECCGIDPAEGGTEPADLVRRGNRAVRVLKRKDSRAFIEAMRSTVYPPGKTPPDQTRALAKIWWPLVLTTNYDDHFETAYNESHPDKRDELLVLGRSPQESQQVLSSLSSTSGCLLWALQGYLHRKDEHRLHPELVVGHEEYRRVTHTAQHFRRAFAEVFRRRSFLFLGSGLSETYLLDLFGEILEFAGANPLAHYAMVKRGQVDVDFLRSRFNIIVLEYQEHDELPVWLNRLGEEIDRAGTRPVRWCYSLTAGRETGAAGGVEDLEIIRGALPPPAEGEVLAVSVGTATGGTLWVGRGVRATVRPFWPAPVLGTRGYAMQLLGARFVYGFQKEDGTGPVPVVAVNARVDEHDRRDLRLIGEAVQELLGWAAAQGFHTVRMQVLASGQSAHYATRFSLAEAVRAFGRWRRETGQTLALRIHVTDPRALLELSAGRLDVVELLFCEDVRFWVEVVDGRQVLEREMVFGDCEWPLRTIATRFDVPRTGWEIDVNPRPRHDSERHTVEKYWDTDLLSVGVVPGATVRFIAALPQPAPPAARPKRTKKPSPSPKGA
jgi:hypothetical protein